MKNYVSDIKSYCKYHQSVSKEIAAVSCAFCKGVNRKSLTIVSLWIVPLLKELAVT